MFNLLRYSILHHVAYATVMSSRPAGPGKPLSSQSKEIVHNVFKYFEEVISKNTSSIENPVTVAAAATGVSISTVKKVVGEGKKVNIEGHKRFSSPERKRSRKCIKSIDDYDREAIKRIIYDLRNSQGEFLTLKTLHKKLIEELGYAASSFTLRKHINLLGFEWRKIENNRRVLMEKQTLAR